MHEGTGTRPGPHDMNDASRTAGCPAAERNALTEPTGGASPIFTSVEVKSPLAQLRHQGRAVPLKRRRTVRDDFLGREGKPSQSLLRKVQRQTLYTCLVQLARGVDARIPNKSLAPVSRASSQLCREKNWIIQFSSGVRPLDFRDHIPVRRGFSSGIDSRRRSISDPCCREKNPAEHREFSNLSLGKQVM